MIRELKTFVAVCELDGFAAAARHVNLTPSAVSAQIKNLEDNLGLSLFTRTARAITLNPQGTRILPAYCQRNLSALCDHAATLRY